MYSAYSTKDCLIWDFFSHFFQNRRKKDRTPKAYSPCFIVYFAKLYKSSPQDKRMHNVECTIHN